MLRERCQQLFPDCAFTMMSSMPLGAPGFPEADFLKKPFTPGECRVFLASHLSIEA
jgi:hypothetical protein